MGNQLFNRKISKYKMNWVQETRILKKNNGTLQYTCKVHMVSYSQHIFCLMQSGTGDHMLAIKFISPAINTFYNSCHKKKLKLPTETLLVFQYVHYLLL